MIPVVLFLFLMSDMRFLWHSKTAKPQVQGKFSLLLTMLIFSLNMCTVGMVMKEMCTSHVLRHVNIYALPCRRNVLISICKRLVKDGKASSLSFQRDLGKKGLEIRKLFFEYKTQLEYKMSCSLRLNMNQCELGPDSCT